MTAEQGTVIKAEAMLFSELFNQGRFEVPWHQRYYDWKHTDVLALLHDIKEALDEGRDCYFLGAIMLIEVNSQEWEINDGQQRMVTISLIWAALCRRFALEMQDSQREGIALRLLFDLDANTICTMDDVELYTPRITPPKNDAARYRQMIRGHMIGTNGLLTESWKEIENFFALMSPDQARRYFDFLLKKLEVACLKVPAHIDPNAVYETINCRGKPLDDFDLIRNYLYSYFDRNTDAERRFSIHENLERIRLIISNSKKATEYMQCHLQCRFGFLRKDQFYRDVKKAIHTQRDKGHDRDKTPADYAFQLTEQITSKEALELYRIITASTPNPDFVRAFEVDSGTTRARRHLAVFLRELRGYKVTQPLVFSILTWYIKETDGRKRKRIAKIANKKLQRLATFILRTAFVAKFEPSHFETEFSNYAKHIASADDISDLEFIDFLKECDSSEHEILEDSKFQSAMQDANMTGNEKIKQFLLGINSYMGGDQRLLNAHHCTVEHILPKSQQHWSGWTGFSDVDENEWIQRIGNLTLMGPSDNKPGPKFNGNFAKKCESYQNSEIALTREISNFSEWTPDTIERRQKEMIKKALEVWTFE